MNQTKSPNRRGGTPAKLDILPAHQREQLKERLLVPGVKYPQVVNWLRTACGVKTSISGVHRFFRRHIQAAIRTPKIAPADFTIETISILRHCGKVLAKSRSHQHFHRVGRSMTRREAISFLQLKLN